MPIFENELKMVNDETQQLLLEYYNDLSCIKETKKNRLRLALDFCIEFNNKEMTYLNVVNYICRLQDWEISRLFHFFKYYSPKINNEVLLNLANNQVKIGSNYYPIIHLHDLTLFPIYYDFLNKCLEAKYKCSRMYDCSWIFIKYLNAIGMNKDNKNIREIWYNYKYDFIVNSIEKYYKDGSVLSIVDLRANLRSKYPDEYRDSFFKKSLNDEMDKIYTINKKITYDFLIYLFNTKDYEPSAIICKMKYLKKFNDFLGCDYSYITQEKIEEFSLIQSKKTKQQRAGIVYVVGELVEYLFDNKVLKNKIVATTKVSKYDPIYIHEYADENDEIRSNDDRKLKFIWFNKLENKECLDVIRNYGIYLLEETKKPYVSVQAIINLLCDLANYTGKKFEQISSDDFLDFFEKYRRLHKTTRNTYNLYFFNFYEWLCQQKYVERNIVNIEYESADYIDKNVSYSAYEMQVLFSNMDKLPDDMYRLALIILASTGMRVSELVDIRRSKIKKIEEFYLIMVKSDKAEKYQKSYISKDIYEYIMNYINKYPSKTDYLFVNNNSRKIKAGSINTILRNYPIENNLLDENGEIIKVNTHKFRHNIAVTLQNSGAPIPIIQCVLNHKSLETTKHYLDNSNEAKRKRRMQALGIEEISEENIPSIRDTYENIINSEVITQILISGACKKKAYTKEGKKCSDNPNECYKCNLFLPDENKLDDYKAQLNEMRFIRDKYVQNGREAELIEIEETIYALTKVINKMEMIYKYEKDNIVRQLSI